jgi:hypothetical protein
LLGVVGDAAGHRQQLGDGDVVPRGVLGEPFAEFVVDGQLSFGFELEQEHGCEGFGVAADLPECVVWYGLVGADVQRGGGTSVRIADP